MHTGQQSSVWMKPCSVSVEMTEGVKFTAAEGSSLLKSALSRGTRLCGTGSIMVLGWNVIAYADTSDTCKWQPTCKYSEISS